MTGSVALFLAKGSNLTSGEGLREQDAPAGCAFICSLAPPLILRDAFLSNPPIFWVSRIRIQ